MALVLLHASGASARSAPTPTDNSTPSATIRNCHSELDTGSPPGPTSRRRQPYPHSSPTVGRASGLAGGAGLGRRIVWKSRSATVTAADSARRRVFLIGVGE